MKNKHLILSSCCALVLLLLGGLAYHFITKHYSHYHVGSVSSIVKLSNKQTTAQATKKITLKTIIHDSQKAVVQIQVKNSDSETIGSGFLYDSRGDIITNAHVVSGAKTVTVKTSDAKTYEGKVIGIGQTTDVAVVRVDKMTDIPPLELEAKGNVQVGDDIIALGSPLGLQNTVTPGIISGTNRDFTIDPFKYHHVYQISAPITHGNSGGPLIDEKTGKVIAINSAGMEEGNIAFSIPIKSVLDQVTDWSEHPQTINGINGSMTQNATQQETGDTLKSDAEYLIKYFYEDLSTHDYVSAYALLGSDWQKRVAYDTFREGYLSTMKITVDNVTGSLSTDGKQVTVIAKITAQELSNNGETTDAKYQVTYTVGYENDELKIKTGKGKAL
ncbi:hypothetical protein GCM10011391_08510 [Pullulanibacillus camelliae]|uniref:Serine protease n=1 Tax=Pullulanibacillus camelliae TaxID=1707096 RepID=A0A8J2YBA5_9BACL|nr:trypsin-like peptidase domain-containing protein [Pullulanibacillus camelliae]GGE32166.1 hypothetical protein GCM10011391_08510 [Pullulanibacillus camelliae]